MNPNRSEEVREILIKRIDQQKQATGMVIGILEPAGRRVIAYGNHTLGNSRPVDGDTIFEIGSISKVFTSLLLADMVSRNEVALDDPAADYLPDQVQMPERSGRRITLLDLSTHTSGLPRLPTNLKPKNAANPYAVYTVDDLYEFLSGFTLPRDPGSEFEYSNLGAGLLGHLLARRAGTDYESLIRTRITQPLNMPDTAIALSTSMQQRMATGHNALLEPVANWDLPTLAGAGALRSSAGDMLTLLEAFLGYTESPLTPAMKAMLEVRRPISPPFEIALGWSVVGDLVWHEGGTGGFRSFLGYHPKMRVGVVVLSNAATMTGVADIGIHLLNPQAPLSNPTPPEPPGQHTEIPIDPKLLDNYIGRYRLMPNLVLEITRNGDRLFAQALVQGIAAPEVELLAEGENKFFSKAGHEIVFETNSEGRATHLSLHRAGRPSMHGPPE